jgi:hypothetical protein
VRNDDLDLDERIQASISPRLAYACNFWAEHLQATTSNVELREAVSEFLHIRLLYWLEVLSLVKNIKAASPALTHVRNWSIVSFI